MAKRRATRTRSRKSDMPASKKRTTKKKARKSSDMPSRADMRFHSADAEKILDECRLEVDEGLDGKKLSDDADAVLRGFFKPKIVRRLKAGGKWDDEKTNPLIVAKHLGQICAVLAKGTEVSATVAQVAALAVQQDEHCTRGGGGAGDWCF